MKKWLKDEIEKTLRQIAFECSANDLPSDNLISAVYDYISDVYEDPYADKQNVIKALYTLLLECVEYADYE